jgi:predicted transcriptional regulator
LGGDQRQKDVKTMTNREFFEKVVFGTEISEEMKDFARDAIVKLDNSNAKRAVYAATKREQKDAERKPIRDDLLAVITDEPKTATTLIAEAGLDIAPQAVPSLLKPAFTAGLIDKEPIKVTGNGTHVGYVKA